MILLNTNLQLMNWMSTLKRNKKDIYAASFIKKEPNSGSFFISSLLQYLLALPNSRVENNHLLRSQNQNIAIIKITSHCFPVSPQRQTKND